MRRVGAGAGLTATAIYRHYASKEALLTAVVEQGFERFGEALWRALAASTPLARLVATSVQYRRFAVENPGYYRVMFVSSPEDFGFDSLPGANQDKLAPTFQFLVDRVRECIEDGVVRTGDPVAIAFTIWSHVHGMVALYLTGNLCRMVPTDDVFATVFDASVARLRDGLLTT